MSLGKNIRALRIKKGLNQTELAVLAKVSQSMISQIESDRYMGMDEKYISSVLNALGVSYDDLETLQIIDENGGEAKFNEMLEKLDIISNLLIERSGNVVEVQPLPVNKAGDTALFPIKFEPVAVIELITSVGEYKPGDILYFREIEEGEQIKPSDIVLMKNEVGQPKIGIGPDNMGIIGKAIRVLKSI